MFQRDIIVDDIRKTALIIAKIFGIKAGGMVNEFKQQFDKTLQNEYAAEIEQLLALNQEDFEMLIKSDTYSAEKLITLSQMLYVFAEPFEATDETAAILKKVLVLFDELETQHHYESFENLNKRNHIYSFFNNNYERS